MLVVLQGQDSPPLAADSHLGREVVAVGKGRAVRTQAAQALELHIPDHTQVGDNFVALAFHNRTPLNQALKMLLQPALACLLLLQSHTPGRHIAFSSWPPQLWFVIVLLVVEVKTPDIGLHIDLERRTLERDRAVVEPFGAQTVLVSADVDSL